MNSAVSGTVTVRASVLVPRLVVPLNVSTLRVPDPVVLFGIWFAISFGIVIVALVPTSDTVL